MFIALDTKTSPPAPFGAELNWQVTRPVSLRPSRTAKEEFECQRL